MSFLFLIQELQCKRERIRFLDVFIKNIYKKKNLKLKDVS